MVERIQSCEPQMRSGLRKARLDRDEVVVLFVLFVLLVNGGFIFSLLGGFHC